MNRLATVVALIVGVAALYLARAVLVPIALAALLTFMVYPIVDGLTRLGLRRAISVGVVVTALFLALGGVFWILTMEFAALSTQIPVYRDNLIAKIGEVKRLGSGGALEKMQTAVTDVARALEKEAAPRAPDAAAPVIVRSEPTGRWQLPAYVEYMGAAGAVIVLVIFMLIEREDLRNRVIRLGGYGRLITTTRVLDEAAHRISRYLLMQTIINTSFGIGITGGLMLLGVPYALLWGFLAAVLRFIPYVGVWLAALIPIVFTLAAFPRWYQPLLVAGIFVVLEVAASFALEPLLYGQSAGVSQVALLCSVAFWAWLWGPIGLVLATPLTVCLVVLAKHVPGLEFIGILMSDEPPIAPAAAYYQRLLAKDRAEAERIVTVHAAEHSLATVFDGVILPALRHARRDRAQDTLSEDAERSVWRDTREIVDALGARQRAAAEAADASPEAKSPPRNVRVVGIPVRDEADRLGLAMLEHLIDPARWTIEIASPHLLRSEIFTLIEEKRPVAVCLGTLPSGSRGRTRYLCKRLRARFPDLRILVGSWGQRDNVALARRQLEGAGADLVSTSLLESRQHLQEVYGLEPPTLRSPVEIEAGASAPATA
ncbi:MAG TPA: AI-2E family transporter [Methylomirabilota bacterium]|nr:AI-2E family transporter [Methylomirabilota bacterium]